MTEEGSSNSDFDLVQIVFNQNNNDDLDIQTKFNNLLIKFNEEKEKNVLLEKEINECFIQIKNKWKEIVGRNCCSNKCINTDKPIGNCIKGNGYINLIDDENIKYINCVERKGYDKDIRIYAEKQFENPEDYINYSLIYFEIKCKIEGENGYKNWMNIGLRNGNDVDIVLIAEDGVIKDEEDEEFKLENFSWNDGDIFGCGLVYPPTEKSEKFNYVFFTKNGKQIGKATILHYDSYKPYVILRCCSVETNFGNNLKEKPFIYDISKHFVIKEFYEDSDVD
uniref:SPRY domain-containing protein n=1 Tax=Meloidogyne hapla TaxID=6305 RepID=A0A1I8C2F5_MELHA